MFILFNRILTFLTEYLHLFNRILTFSITENTLIKPTILIIYSSIVL